MEDQWKRFIEDVAPSEPPVQSRKHFDEWGKCYRDSVVPDEDARWSFDAVSACPIKRDIKISRATHLMQVEVMRASRYRETNAFLLGGDQAASPRVSKKSCVAEAIASFIDNERFGSKKTEASVLSLSTCADSCPPRGLAVEEQHFDETDVGEVKTCTITEISPLHESNSGPQFDLVPAHLQIDPRADRLVDCQVFESITNPDKLLILGSWRDRLAAGIRKPLSFDGAGKIRHREAYRIRWECSTVARRADTIPGPRII